MRIAVVTSLALVLLFLGSMPFVQAQSDFMSPNDIEGEYEDESAALSIVFPAGWKGINLFGISVMVAPDGVNFMQGPPEASMMIVAFNHSAFTGLIDQSATFNQTEPSNECKYDTQSIKTVNGMSTLYGISECESPDRFVKTNVYLFVTDEKILGVMFMANSTSAYDRHVNEFERSIETLRIQNTISVEQGLTKIWSLGSTTKSLMVKSSSVDLRIDSSSTIDDVSIDEGSKTVSIKLADRDDKRGFMRVPISDVLEGPYVVTVDGNIVEVSIINEESTGRTYMMMPYEPDAEEIVITGTNVVPEFPIVALAAAGGMAGVIFLARIKSYKR